MAGCRWKQSYERDREKKMHGPLLILAFFVEGEREDKKKLPKAAPGMAEVALARNPIATKRKLRAACHTLWMKFTITKTRQISPDLDLCPVKSPSLIQAQKG